MSTKDDAIPQAVLDNILARALTAPPDPELKPLVSIHRIFCHRARVTDLPTGASTNRPRRLFQNRLSANAVDHHRRHRTSVRRVIPSSDDSAVTDFFDGPC